MANSDTKVYRYYCLMRPAGPGAVPRGFTSIEDLDGITIIESINHHPWSIVEYDKPLTDKEVRDYELAPVI